MRSLRQLLPLTRPPPPAPHQRLSQLPAPAPARQVSGASLRTERCVSCGTENRFLPSHPHIRSLQLASCDWPELSLLEMRRIQSSNQLRKNNTYHLAAADLGCSTPSSGQAGAPQAGRSSIPEALSI